MISNSKICNSAREQTRIKRLMLKNIKAKITTTTIKSIESLIILNELRDLLPKLKTGFKKFMIAKYISSNSFSKYPAKLLFSTLFVSKSKLT